MGDIFLLNINLIRKRFKIYGVFNILSLFFVIGLILSGIKFFQNMSDSYQQTATFEFLMIFVLFSGNIFSRKYSKKCGTLRTYFPIFSMRDIENYYSKINLIFYEFALLFVLFPVHMKDFNWFIILILTNNMLLLSMIIIKNKVLGSSYANFSNILKAIVCMIIFAYMRNLISFSPVDYISKPNLILIILLSFFTFYMCLSMIRQNSMVLTDGVLFLKATKKINILNKNHDLLRIFRKNGYINALILVLISNISINDIITETQDSLWIYTLSLISTFFSIFLDLLSDEKGKGIFFYSLANGTKVKQAKIKSTIYVSVLMVPILFLSLLLVLDFKMLCIGYINAVIIFFITASIYRLKIDKNDFEKVYTGRQELILILTSLVLSWIINYNVR